MNIFKNKVEKSSSRLIRPFDESGKIIINEDTAWVMDTILTVLAAGVQIKNLFELHLELARCSIYILHPDLKSCVRELMKDGLIKYGAFSVN